MEVTKGKTTLLLAQEAKGMSSAGSSPHFFFSGPIPHALCAPLALYFPLILHWKVRMDFAVLSQLKSKGLYHVDIPVPARVVPKAGREHLSIRSRAVTGSPITPKVNINSPNQACIPIRVATDSVSYLFGAWRNAFVPPNILTRGNLPAAQRPITLVTTPTGLGRMTERGRFPELHRKKGPKRRAYSLRLLPPVRVAARPALEGKISKAGKERGSIILTASRELADRRSIQNGLCVNFVGRNYPFHSGLRGIKKLNLRIKDR
uniref:Uncharacterized protein n=1 Tax=Solanum lycopersicum TaxID=4081 RepID=A0A3Q7IUU8_SOLLC